MKNRKAKIVEIILRTICIVSLIFIFVCNSIKPMIISFILYFTYKVIKEIILFIKRIIKKETHKAVDTILLLERLICYIVLICVFLKLLLK